jgi:surfeit locus 1 family protein
VATIAVVALTARLGLWQLDRAEQKLALQAARDAADAQAPTSSLDAPGLDHRRARAQGRWRPELQFWLGNRPLDKQVGFVLLTPLQLDDGRLLWVQRGWQARRASTWEAPEWPPTPDASVLVEGRLRPQASLAYELGAAPQSGAVRQNLDLSSSPEPGRRLLPWVLWQSQDCAPLRCDWPAPSLGVEKHHGYAAQWFALSLLTCGLYVWFQLIAPWRRARSARPAA